MRGDAGFQQDVFSGGESEGGQERESYWSGTTRRHRRTASNLQAFTHHVTRARRNLEAATDAIRMLPSRRFIAAYRNQLRTVTGAMALLQKARKIRPSTTLSDPDLGMENAASLNKQIGEQIKIAKAALRRAVDLISDSRDVDVVSAERLMNIILRVTRDLKVL